MLIETRTENENLIIGLDEERLDAANAQDFKDDLFKRIDEGNNNIVFDMSAISFIDSCGIGALVSALKKLGEGGDMKLTCITPAVMTVLKLTRLDKAFHIFGSTQEALAA